MKKRGNLVQAGCMGMLLWGIGNLNGAEWVTFVARGDALAKQHQPALALEQFRQADRISPENVEILSRISEQLGDLAETEHSEEKARQSLQFATKAVELNPQSSRAHVDLAIAYGKLTDYCDNRTKLEYSKLIRKEAETALQLDKANALAAHVLGRWHLGMVTLNPILKAMARLVYGEMPPGSLDEAVRYLQQAVDLEPSSISYHQSLAQALTRLGDKPKARTHWEQVLRLSPDDKEEIAAQKQARAALGL